MLRAKQSLLSYLFTILILLIFIPVFVLSFNKQEGLKDRIRKASSFEDIFQLEKTIVPEEGKGYSIDKIEALVKSSTGDLIMKIDGKGVLKVLVFDENGKYKNPIGKAGYEEGEYFIPWSIGVDSYDNIYVLDQPHRRINIYDINNHYKKSLKYNCDALYMHTNSCNEIYLYNGMNSGKQYNCITKISPEGKQICEFAELPKEIMPVNYHAMVNTMAIDKKDFVYEVNPLWSDIRKYNSNGFFITEFGEKEVKMNQQTDKSEALPRVVEALFIYDEVVMVIYDNNKMDFYDPDGELLNKDVIIKGNIVSSSDNEIYMQSEKKEGGRAVLLKYCFKNK
jgi:hypothetical protein